MNLHHGILLLYTMLCISICYVCFFSSPESSKVNKFFTVTTYNKLLEYFERIFGSSSTDSLKILIDYIMNKPNPIMQIFYLSIVLPAWTTFILYGYPLIPNHYLPEYHKYVGYLTFFICITTFVKACTTPPGYINARNINKYDNYSYDNVLFTNRICKTVKIRKIARSKFDSMTNRHVARFDHYCVWLNNSVGEENYRFFLIFLAVHMFMLSYGSYAIAQIFRHDTLVKNLFGAKYMYAGVTEPQPATKRVVAQYIIYQHPHLVGLFILSTVMGIVMFFFLGFHLYVSARGMTTNEYFKWGDVNRWHKRELKKYNDAKALDEKSVGKVVNWANWASDDVGSILLVEEEGEKEKKEKKNCKNIPPDTDSIDVGCVSATPSTPASEAPLPESKLILHPGPKPKNIYNNGIFANFADIFFPRCNRVSTSTKKKKKN